jgi:periplasmic divalent cation tolerance protein
MQPQSDAVLIYTTFPSLESAERVGRLLIVARLVACANILPGMVSLYEWKGALQRDEEVVMILKTSAECRAAAMSAVAANHSYETPAVLALDISDGYPAYLAWIGAQSGERR